MKYICIDFDGTIVDHEFPKIGKPVPYAVEWMKKFIEFGSKIILSTMRSDGIPGKNYLTQAVDYIKNNDIELFGINHNPTQDTWTNSPKAYGHVYIDDAAIGCPLISIPDFKRLCVDWYEVGPMVLELL